MRFSQVELSLECFCSVWISCLSYNFFGHLFNRMLDLECMKSCADTAGAIFYSMMKLSLETPHSSLSKFFYVFLFWYTFRSRILISYLISNKSSLCSEVIVAF
jgi:hypothetical protein